MKRKLFIPIEATTIAIIDCKKNADEISNAR